MPHIYYDEGPPTVSMGAAGVFQKGVSRDIPDELAVKLLKKESIKFQEGVRPVEEVGQVRPAKAKEVTADAKN